MLRILNEELEGLLFLEPEAVQYAILQKSSPVGTRDGGSYVLQTFVSVPYGRRGEDARKVKARISSVMGDLTENSGPDGVLVLESLGDGVSKGSRWRPLGISQHRGDETGPDVESAAKSVRGYPDTYELVTFWKSEGEREAARAWLEEILPDSAGHGEERYGGFASSSGELALRA